MPTTKSTRRFFSRPRWDGVLVALALMGGLLGVSDRRAASEPGGKILARVNGTPIYESEINTNLPKDVFDATASELRQVKLERLIRQTQMREFLKMQRVPVQQSEVDKAIALLRKTPPAQGCACCRYSSLDEYLKSNSYTLREFSQEVRNDVGLEKYVLNLWDQAYPTKQSRSALINSQRPQIEKLYTRAWHIFFNTFQKLSRRTDPAKVGAEAKARAEAAWKRLQKGEPFAKVAKQVSEDQISKTEGGSLGFIAKSAYGKDFEAMLGKLKPGEVSRPFASVYGVHILKWEPIKDEELLSICKMDFTTRTTGEVLDKAERTIKVIKY